MGSLIRQGFVGRLVVFLLVGGAAAAQEIDVDIRHSAPSASAALAAAAVEAEASDAAPNAGPDAAPNAGPNAASVGAATQSPVAESVSPAALAQQISTSNDPAQLYQLGLRALAINQPDLARQAFERVVGLQPRFAGAWLDLALATSRAGDNAAAVEHLEYLRSQFVLAPALAVRVEKLIDFWQNGAATTATATSSSTATTFSTAANRGWQGDFTFGLGRDSNANAGPIRQQIPLSLASGSTLFDIDDAFLPRADRFAQVGVNLSGPSQNIGGGRASPILLLRSKQLAADKNFSPLDLQLGVVYQLPAGASAQDELWQLNLFAQNYRLGGQALFNGLRLGLQRNWLVNSCQATATGELESRFYQRVPVLGSTLCALQAGLACPVSSAFPAAMFGAPQSTFFGVINKGTLSGTAKLGFEQARFDRPGGNNRSIELAVRYDQPLSATQSLQAGWQIVQTADQSGYSPLLELNAARRIQRQTFTFGLRQSLAPLLEARLNFEYFQQRANLPLFEQQGNTLTLGLAWRFE